MIQNKLFRKQQKKINQNTLIREKKLWVLIKVSDTVYVISFQCQATF